MKRESKEAVDRCCECGCAGSRTGNGCVGRGCGLDAFEGDVECRSGGAQADGQGAGWTGTFTATLSGTKLTWKLTFQKLSGKAGAAHIHLGRPGKAGNVAVSLCGPCASGVSGKATLTPAQVKAILAGGTYVNVHTAKNAGGEIRGQITKAASRY